MIKGTGNGNPILDAHRESIEKVLPAESLVGLIQEAIPKEALNKPFSPLAKLSAIVASCATIVGAVWAIDERYASAADVSGIESQISTKQIEFKQEIFTIQKNRDIIDLEDKLFVLDMKVGEQTATNVDRAMKERYQRRLEGLQQNGH